MRIAKNDPFKGGVARSLRFLISWKFLSLFSWSQTLSKVAIFIINMNIHSYYTHFPCISMIIGRWVWSEDVRSWHFHENYRSVEIEKSKFLFHSNITYLLFLCNFSLMRKRFFLWSIFLIIHKDKCPEKGRVGFFLD